MSRGFRHRKPPPSPVRVRLYTWSNKDSEQHDFGVVYTSAAKREAIVQRMSTATEMPLPIQNGDFPISDVKNERVREGWTRSAREQGAVLAIGFAALQER